MLSSPISVRTGRPAIAAARVGRPSPSGRMPAAARAAGVAAAVCLALTLGFAQAAPAGAETAFSETTATIKTAFSPDRLGAQAAFAFTVHFSGGEFGAPSPVRRAVLHLPPGLRMHIPSLRDCTRAHLQARRPVSYTHLRAHETGRNLVCRLLLEKKK